MQQPLGWEPRVAEFAMGFYINKEKYQLPREFRCSRRGGGLMAVLMPCWE